MNNNLIIRSPDGATNPVLEKYFRDLNDVLKFMDVSTSFPQDDRKKAEVTLHFRPNARVHEEQPEYTKFLVERLHEIITAWMRDLMCHPNNQVGEDSEPDDRIRVLRFYSASILINGKIFTFMWPRSTSMGHAFDCLGQRDQADVRFAFSKVEDV